MFRKNIIWLFLLTSFCAWSQLSTSNALTAEQLVRNVLAGEGVKISNVSYSGSPIAIGSFNGAASNIGLPEGVLLSTGSVLNHTATNGNGQNGPVGPNNFEHASTDHGLAGDNDIELLAGGTTNSYDAAVLEFDFIPEGDTVKFRYVFASEEYPEYVNTKNNDAFGFFINGAGFPGATNIALLPDNVTNVSINNVNAGKNATYFVSNGEGKIGQPQYSDQTVVNFNGFTKVLEAVAKVTPCETYHLKMVIADLGDRRIDSGVFLEANSLQSAPNFEINQNVDYAPSGSSVEIFEGCSKGELHITRSKKLDVPLSIPFKVYGTATSGLDYVPFPTTINFSPGEKNKTIVIDPVRDPINDDGETIILRFKNPSICEKDSLDILYTFRDQPEFVASFVSKAVDCPGENIAIAPQVSGGVPAYTYSWTGFGSGATVSVSPSLSTTYYYRATDACGQFVDDSVRVEVPVYSPISFVPMNDTTIRCRGEQITSTALGLEGAGDYTYSWDSGETGASATHQILNTETYTVNITDKCGNSTSDAVQISLNYPSFTATGSNDTLICVGDVLEVSGSGNGGIPPYTYSWEGQAGAVYNHQGVVNQTITLTAYDSCAIIPATHDVNISVQQPFADFEFNAPIPEPYEPIEMLNKSQGAVAYEWEFDNGSSSTDENPSTKYYEVGAYTVSLTAEDQLGCRDTASYVLQLRHPLYYYLPNAFSPNGDDINDVLVGKHVGVTNFTLRVFDQWGKIMFHTFDPDEAWDGRTHSGKPAPLGVYVVKYKATSIYRTDKEIEKVQTLTIVR